MKNCKCIRQPDDKIVHVNDKVVVPVKVFDKLISNDSNPLNLAKVSDSSVNIVKPQDEFYSKLNEYLAKDESKTHLDRVSQNESKLKKADNKDLTGNASTKAPIDSNEYCPKANKLDSIPKDTNDTGYSAAAIIRFNII